MVNEMGARAEGYKQLDEVIRQWKGEPGGLLPVMQQAQNIIGCVDEEVQNYIAEAMEVPVTDIYGIATFYSLFSLEPKGKYAVGLCLGTACYVKGAQLVLDELQRSWEAWRSARPPRMGCLPWTPPGASAAAAWPRP